MTPNDVRVYRFVTCMASFSLPGLCHVLSSRTLAAFAWMCVFFVTALGERLLILPLPLVECQDRSPTSHFWYHRSSWSFALPRRLNCFYVRRGRPRGPMSGAE